MPPPVKTAACALGIPVYQPDRFVRERIRVLDAYPADVYVVAAFGKVLRPSVLGRPRLGCVNVHASLLPRWRGASPVTAAVLAGDAVSGVTTMLMDPGLDTGAILMQKEIPLSPDETGGSLEDKLSALGAELILPTLAGLEDGSIVPRPQEGESTYVGLLEKEMGEIDFSLSAAVVERMVRAYDPWPGTFTFLRGKLLKIRKAAVLSGTADMRPGTVIRADKSGFDVQTGDGILRILTLQPEGKKSMDAAAFLRGASVKAGEMLGRQEK